MAMTSLDSIPLDPGTQRTIRRLRDLIEPLAASVYFAPECHANYEALGFGPPAGAFRGVVGPERRAYFASRGGCMGEVPGEMVTAAFGVFSPAVVVPAVTEAWTIASREQLLAARLDGQRRFLARVLSASTAEVARATELMVRMAEAGTMAGHALYAGLRSLGWPGDAYGDLWRAADLVREHRGDGHIAAWLAEGLTAPEIMLLTELWWGIPPRSYAITRGWTDAEYDAAQDRIEAAGWVESGVDGGALTAEGRDLRRRIETATDAQELAVITALGADADELVALLEPMAADIVANQGYPPNAFATTSDLDAV